jgi:hypothetical protein
LKELKKVEKVCNSTPFNPLQHSSTLSVAIALFFLKKVLLLTPQTVEYED